VRRYSYHSYFRKVKMTKYRIAEVLEYMMAHGMAHMDWLHITWQTNTVQRNVTIQEAAYNHK